VKIPMERPKPEGRSAAVTVAALIGEDCSPSPPPQFNPPPPQQQQRVKVRCAERMVFASVSANLLLSVALCSCDFALCSWECSWSVRIRSLVKG
jgi:hypothetical protein